jgi:hypothetical protein
MGPRNIPHQLRNSGDVENHSFRWPDTILNIFSSLTSRRSTKPKSGSRLLEASGSLSHTGPPFQRPWGLAFWRPQNLRLFLLRIMRAKAIELTRTYASAYFGQFSTSVYILD